MAFVCPRFARDNHAIRRDAFALHGAQRVADLHVFQLFRLPLRAAQHGYLAWRELHHQPQAVEAAAFGALFQKFA